MTVSSPYSPIMQKIYLGSGVSIMKKFQKQIIIFSCLMIASMVAGFIVCASSPSNVFYGIAIMLGGCFIFGCITVISSIKMMHLKEQAKEERIKILEDEVESLKTSHN
jgi:hypothetical protein